MRRILLVMTMLLGLGCKGGDGEGAHEAATPGPAASTPAPAAAPTPAAKAAAPGEPVGSCVFGPDELCLEFVNLRGITREQLQKGCGGPQMQGTWSSGPCARENAVGGCKRDVRTSLQTTWYPKGFRGDLAAVKAACQGTWITP